MVNKLGALAQIEGGIIDGLSATIYGGITIQEGRVVESNFHNCSSTRACVILITIFFSLNIMESLLSTPSNEIYEVILDNQNKASSC